MTLFESGIRPAIDEYLLAEAAKARDYGNYWSASSAGYCMRRNIFERLKVPHIEKEGDGRKQRVFTAGHLFHDWIQGITKEAGLSIASEIELQDEDLMVRGHFDDLVLVEREVGNEVFSDGKTFVEKNTFVDAQPHLILYDYKTRNSRNFNFSKSPSYFHRLQLGTYLLMIRRLQKEEVKPTWLDNLPELTEARVLNIEKDTLRMSEVQYLWDTQLESDVLSYWNSLNTHWKAKTLPKCTCADHEGGFLAKEAYNPYFYEGTPCSLEYYNKFKKGEL